jgi:hypothetical protein
MAGRRTTKLPELGFIVCGKAERMHQAVGRVSIRVRRATLELLDRVHAQASALGDTLLGEPEVQAMSSQ